VTTAQIAASLRRWGRFNHSVALSGICLWPPTRSVAGSATGAR
jgi:hypothetical protein